MISTLEKTNIVGDDMREEYLVKIFKALAHPVRLKIVKKLVANELCVCELNEDIEFTQSNLSQHLKILKDAGVLKSRKIGLNMYYAIQDERVKSIIGLAEDMLEDRMNK